MKKQTLTFALAACLLIPDVRVQADEALFTMPAAEFFQMQRVQQPIDLSGIDSRLLSAAIFHATNQRRKKHNLGELGHQPGLREAAQMHARSMAGGGYLSHTNPDDPERRTPWDRVSLTGLKPSFVAENVATHFGMQYESGTPFYPAEKNGTVQFSATPGGPPIPPHTYGSFAQTLLDQWMGSPEHRKNILAEQARHLGAAAVKRDSESPLAMDKFFCVQVFGAL